MLGLVLLGAALHAAPPPTAVLVARRTSVSMADANALAQAVSVGLVENGVPLTLDADAARAALERLGLKDASQCTGRKACLTGLGKELAVRFLVSVSVSQVGSDRAVALELLEVTGAAVREKDALILSPGVALTAKTLAAFSAKLRARLGVADPPPPPPVEPKRDTPLVEAPPPLPPPTVTPVPVVVAPVAPLPPPPPRSHVASFVLGAAGLALLGAATGLLVSGLGARADAYRTEVVDGVTRSPYAASEVQARAGAGNTQLGFAGGAAAAGLGLGVAAVVAW